MFLFLLFVDLDMSHMSLLESSGWFETTNQPRCPSHSVERHFWGIDIGGMDIAFPEDAAEGNPLGSIF